jgi:cytochrome c peroxidase
MARVASLALAVFAPLACADGPGDEPEPFVWPLRDTWPVPVVPDDNPMSNEKVALGRHLFYDVRLSGNETQSCGSCHEPARAFTDGRATAKGSTDEDHPRGSMSLVNVAYASTLGWANQTLRVLEDQALVPLFGTHPVELGLAGREDELIERLSVDAFYVDAFSRAFVDDDEPVTLSNVVKAISAFERTILSSNSRFDRFWYDGENDALSDEEKQGLSLFMGERLECFHCHGGFNFTDASTHDADAFEVLPFHNTGLYNLDGTGAYPIENQGLIEQTGQPADMGRFKAPTLRNIALTAPYMHDGSMATLDDVIDHYARGGRLIDEGPHAGDGAENPYKNGFVAGFLIDERERAALKAFLSALTDDEMRVRPSLQNPFAGSP